MGMTDLFAGDLIEQFRLVRFQLYNWGTFQGLHDMTIAEEGHLFVGGSGSGKSTLLDAMSVLLTPGRINFNAAAREGEKKSDRSLLSYMRGAWTSQQGDDGKAVVQYLRQKATWSAIALTYKSVIQTVTLLFVGYVRGQSGEQNAVNAQYFVVNDAIEVKAIVDDARTNGFEMKHIMKLFPQAKAFRRFAPYSEWFRAIFGIEDETTLKLLHKAQSARNLGDLNQFLRNFMLEEPKTFDIAETLVEKFTDLHQAHVAVVRARDQVQTLSVAKKAFDEYEEAFQEKNEMQYALSMMDGWYLTEQKRLLDLEIPQIQERLKKHELHYQEAQTLFDRLNEEIADLNRQHYEKGGATIDRLQRDRQQRQKELERIRQNLNRMKSSLSCLQMNVPISMGMYEKMHDQLQLLNTQLEESLETIQRERDVDVGQQHEMAKKIQEVTHEIDSMKARTSNIPSPLIALREEIARDLKLTTNDLPFVGELIEVRQDSLEWQGAIERVLRNFSLSLLVKDVHYMPLVRYLDSRQLGGRLVYYRVLPSSRSVDDVDDRKLLSKLQIQEGPWARWLKQEIAHRFDYACVKSSSEFSIYEKAVTMAGQVKHSKVRHEKDDRHPINDSRHWVTGFSNQQKLAAFMQSAKELADHYQKITIRIAEKDKQQKQNWAKQSAINVCMNFSWSEINENDAVKELMNLDRQIQELSTQNVTLQDIIFRRDNKLKAFKQADEQKQHCFSICQEDRKVLSERQEMLELTENELGNVDFDEAVVGKMKVKSSAYFKTLTLRNLPQVREKLFAALTNASSYAQDKMYKAESEMKESFASFKQRWPEQSLDLDTSLASAPEFFAKLARLQADGLPRYEQKFKELLSNHAKQDLTDLYTELDMERRAIKNRLSEVNKSLARVVFNRVSGRESYLRIKVSDKHLPEVLEFKQMQTAIMRMALTEMDTQQAEIYFDQIRTLVDRLRGGSANEEYLRWRQKVLDVRLHVEFQGVEFEYVNGEENVVEVYDGVGGKSGGQRQKLTTVCLAAALRYQLGGKENDYPSFAPVVLDEAFDKADSEFTEIALNVFKDFHFQMIIATPEKSIYTLDPYVGGTSLVICKDRCYSSVLPIIFDRQTGSIRASDA